MRHKTHAELWSTTPFRLVQKIILFGFVSKNNRSEGIVSKRKHSTYCSGRCPDWLKMRNADAPAVKREAEEEWNKKGRR